MAFRTEGPTPSTPQDGASSAKPRTRRPRPSREVVLTTALRRAQSGGPEVINAPPTADRPAP